MSISFLQSCVYIDISEETGRLICFTKVIHKIKLPLYFLPEYAKLNIYVTWSLMMPAGTGGIFHEQQSDKDDTNHWFWKWKYNSLHKYCSCNERICFLVFMCSIFVRKSAFIWKSRTVTEWYGYGQCFVLDKYVLCRVYAEVLPDKMFVFRFAGRSMVCRGIAFLRRSCFQSMFYI